MAKRAPARRGPTAPAPPLAGCAIGTSSGVTTPPCAAQTAAAATAGATATSTPGAGTRVEGPLVITTDRTVYASADVVRVTITNQLHASSNLPVVVRLLPKWGCDIARVERLQGSVWEDVPVCHPRGGGEANLPGIEPVTVEPGMTYNFFLSPGSPPPHSTDFPFPTGTYHVLIRFELFVNVGSVESTSMTGPYGFAAYSQPVRVCTCGVCA